MALGPLVKAAIFNTTTGQAISVMYNPEELRLEQGNQFSEIGIPGLDVSPIQYIRGKSRVLSMDLFFDSYETGEDVRRHSNQVVRLLDKNERTKAPPVLIFSMGQFQFQCVLVEAAQRFTMFLRDGTPARTVLSVKFQEFVRVSFEIRQGFFIGPPTLHHIAEKQTLPALAAEYLGDPARWREIANANKVADPLRIKPGTPLIIPQGKKS
jgi:hypothetical protein